MSFKEKLIFWAALAIFFGVFLYMISGILLPFVVALIAAYFLDPAADKLEALGLSRTSATLVITSLFFSIVLIAFILLAPLLYDQFLAMMHKIPDYIVIAKTKILPRFSSIMDKIDPNAIDKAKESFSEGSGYLIGFLGKILNNVWNSGLALVNLLSLLFVTPIVTFYMLRDWNNLIEKIHSWMPVAYAPVIKQQLNEIDRTLSGYIRGQTNVCLLLGFFYATGLTLAGLEFGFVIGLATGILAFIPYVGLLFGFATGIIIAILQFGNVLDVSVVASVFILGQVIEGNFITPKLVGDKVGLHPVWIIFGMMAGATMFGFLGILVAIPVTAIIGVLTRFFLQLYLKSAFYQEQKTKTKKTKAPA